MITINRQWQSTTAALVATVITATAALSIIPLTPSQAQTNIDMARPRTVIIPASANVSLPVKYTKEKIIVGPGETVDITLEIANDIIDNRRNILIPINTQVIGRLEPVYLNNRSRNQENLRGVQFVARELIFPSGKRQSINATSQTVTKLETITRNDNSRIGTDAAIGAGVATTIALITGNRKIEVLEPLGGAAAGALASLLVRKKSVEVFVITSN